MTDYAAQMRPLIDRLNEASRAYYTLGESSLSDMQWDQLYDRLAALEKESGLVLEDSPTHRVGGDVLPDPGEKCVLVIGNEGNGVSDAVAAQCEKYRLPMYGRAESLNASVAAGILIYELARKMRG